MAHPRVEAHNALTHPPFKLGPHTRNLTRRETFLLGVPSRPQKRGPHWLTKVGRVLHG